MVSLCRKAGPPGQVVCSGVRLPHVGKCDRIPFVSLRMVGDEFGEAIPSTRGMTEVTKWHFESAASNLSASRKRPSSRWRQYCADQPKRTEYRRLVSCPSDGHTSAGPSRPARDGRWAGAGGTDICAPYGCINGGGVPPDPLVVSIHAAFHVATVSARGRLDGTARGPARNVVAVIVRRSPMGANVNSVVLAVRDHRELFGRFSNAVLENRSRYCRLSGEGRDELSVFSSCEYPASGSCLDRRLGPRYERLR